jgi:hypothetical protein
LQGWVGQGRRPIFLEGIRLQGIQQFGLRLLFLLLQGHFLLLQGQQGVVAFELYVHSVFTSFYWDNPL